MIDINIFYDNGKLNKNKLRESWVMKNMPDLYKIVINGDYFGSKFSQMLYNYINNITINKCICCDDGDKRFIGFDSGYNDFCSKRCASKQTRHIVEETRRKNTLDKYGVYHTSMLDSVKDKQLNTNMEKYGVKSPAQSDVIKNKVVLNNKSKWGVDYPQMLDSIKDKMMSTRIDKYRYDTIIKYSELNIVEISKEGVIDILCSDCSKTYTISSGLLNHRVNRYKTNPCLICNPISSYKYTGQNDIADYIDGLDIDIIRGDRKILNGKEIDIICPDFNVGIEFNGLYWHSDIYKNKKYHLLKKELAARSGINLIHIWEDDWILKRDIVLSRLSGILNKNSVIYARKCDIKYVDTRESVSFVNDNHIQGNIGSNVKIGLYYKDELVSIMTFGNYRRSLGKNTIENEYELYRFCSKKYTNVIGAFSRLLKFFIKNHSPKKIITYANYDWSSIDNNVYIKNGFKFCDITKPNYWYFNSENKRIHRFAFNKAKLVKDGYDPSFTEYEIMCNRGYNRLYDCGNLKYEMILPNPFFSS